MQKTEYDRRISDWSSDVCSSELPARGRGAPFVEPRAQRVGRQRQVETRVEAVPVERGDGVVQLRVERVVVRKAHRRALPVGPREAGRRGGERQRRRDRKSVVEGKSVSVRVDLGGRRLINTKRTSDNI